MTNYKTASFQKNPNLISDVIYATLKNSYHKEYKLLKEICPGYIERYFYIKLANSANFLNLMDTLYIKKHHKKKFIFESDIEYNCANTLNKKKALKLRIIKKLNFKEIIKNNKLFILLYFLILLFFYKFKKENNNLNQFRYIFYCTSNFEIKYFDKIKNIFPNHVFSDNFKLFCFYLKKIKISLFLKQIFFCIKNFNKLNYHIIIAKLFDNNVSKKFNIIFFEGDNPRHYLYKTHNTICFQHGSFLSKNVPIYFKDMNFDYFLTWGNFYKKKFELFNKYKCKFLTFGKIKLANSNLNFKSDKAKYILFASETISQDISEENYINYFKILEKLSINNSDYTFLLRPHPKYPIEDKILKKYCYSKNIVQIDSNNVNIENNLVKSKIIVFCTSTSFSDALVFDVIPISYYLTNAQLNPDLNKYKIGYQSKNKDKIITFIQKLIDNKKYYNLIKENIKKEKKNFVKIPNIRDFNNLKKLFN